MSEWLTRPVFGHAQVIDVIVCALVILIVGLALYRYMLKQGKRVE